MADDLETGTLAAGAAPQTDQDLGTPPPETPAEPLPAATEAAPETPAEAAPAEKAVEPEPLKRADETETLLETAKAPGQEEAAPKDDKAKDAATDKAADAKKAEPEKKPDDAKATDKPAEAEHPVVEPIEYEYKLPETLQMDDALKGDLHKALDDFRADPVKGVQGLIDLHEKQMGAYSDHLLREQHRVFGETRKGWQDNWKGDEQIGGAGYETALMAIARMRDQFASNARPGSERYEAEMKAFDEMLRITGAGDHPALGRLLHNVAAMFDAPSAPTAEIKPPPGIGRTSARDQLYSHPTSNPKGNG